MWQCANMYAIYIYNKYTQGPREREREDPWEVHHSKNPKRDPALNIKHPTGIQEKQC